jgi:Flp pilus assembly pilin Flp
MWNDCIAYVQLYAGNVARSDAGQGLTEYALIIGVVALALVTILGVMEGGISNLFNTVINGFSGA